MLFKEGSLLSALAPHSEANQTLFKCEDRLNSFLIFFFIPLKRRYFLIIYIYQSTHAFSWECEAAEDSWSRQALLHTRRFEYVCGVKRSTKRCFSTSENRLHRIHPTRLHISLLLHFASRRERLVSVSLCHGCLTENSTQLVDLSICGCLVGLIFQGY